MASFFFIYAATRDFTYHLKSMYYLILLVPTFLLPPTMEPPVPVYSKAAYNITPLSDEQRDSLLLHLDEETIRITQRSGTEQPFCGTLLDNKKEGFYACSICGLPLFASDHKFTSGTGWPSFYASYDEEHVLSRIDNSFDLNRVEIMCARCNSHLGHVFEDGPKPSGKRYCLNSASLHFYEDGEELPKASQPVKTETAYFAGGCFWGVEYWLQQGIGVINVESGYMQGTQENPEYKEVCDGSTGHAETAKVVFDPHVISFSQLLQAFFKLHDPTQLNRQGPDIGTQYRSGIWTTSEEQQKIATSFIDKLRQAETYTAEIVTQIEPAKTFYTAEEAHQDYVEKTGQACHVTNPWE